MHPTGLPTKRQNGILSHPRRYRRYVPGGVAHSGSVDLRFVDESEIKVYFGAMLLIGAIAVAVRPLGDAFGIEILDLVSLVLILGAVLLVSGAVVYSSGVSIREEPQDNRRSIAAD